MSQILQILLCTIIIVMEKMKIEKVNPTKIKNCKEAALNISPFTHFKAFLLFIVIVLCVATLGEQMRKQGH